MEAAHFILNFEVGYGLALGACALIERGLRMVQPQPSWPTSWPVILQLVLAVFLYEGLSYWQHRLLHRFPTLWRFHALHHSGARLNLVRAVRFHIVDFATASFTAYLPLVLLGTPEMIITLLAVLVSLLGILTLQTCACGLRSFWTCCSVRRRCIATITRACPPRATRTLPTP